MGTRIINLGQKVSFNSPFAAFKKDVFILNNSAFKNDPFAPVGDKASREFI